MGSEQEWKLVPVVPTDADRRAALACANEACRNMAGELDLDAMARHFAKHARPPQDVRAPAAGLAPDPNSASGSAASPAPADDVAALRAERDQALADGSAASMMFEQADERRDAAEAALAEARAEIERLKLWETEAGIQREKVGRLTADRDRLAEAADYLIDRYRRCHAGKKVRDLEEAEEAYKSARSLASLPEPEKDAGK